MHLIRTRLHGLIDYGMGIILLMPWITGYFAGEKDTWILGLIGLVIILYSLLTNYEAGLMKFLPVSLNRLLDFIAGVALLFCSFLFSVNHYYFYWPLVLGCIMIVVSAVSSSVPYRISKRDTNITQPL
jgi:hypothetical protein